MKNLLLILLLANVLYFMWGMLSKQESEPGVALLEESELGPPLSVTTGRDSDSVASVGAVLGSGEPSALQAVVGRACVTIGPFRDKTDADSAVLVYTSEGMNVALRSTRAQIFVGHWVQIRNVANEAEANAMLGKLQTGGLSDAYLVRTDDEGLKISLGLFGDLERAEKIELEARSLDLNPEISPRTRESDVYFVDIGLPPGKGAGAIIEKYGEDRVLLRDKATCPQ
ncbi:MAG TPA: SPOR domain-containing protein [Woeseiaceae bacterium]|nr:SPOR domain-containing protein [Woeseiaceae bacterium]